MTFIFRNRTIFGTSQNGIEDKQSGTEGVYRLVGGLGFDFRGDIIYNALHICTNVHE